MKGVLAIKGQEQRFVFQGIHMLFDGQPMTPWGDEPRSNKMIFIGKVSFQWKNLLISY